MEKLWLIKDCLNNKAAVVAIVQQWTVVPSFSGTPRLHLKSDWRAVLWLCAQIDRLGILSTNFYTHGKTFCCYNNTNAQWLPALTDHHGLVWCPILHPHILDFSNYISKVTDHGLHQQISIKVVKQNSTVC